MNAAKKLISRHHNIIPRKRIWKCRLYNGYEWNAAKNVW